MHTFYRSAVSDQAEPTRHSTRRSDKIAFANDSVALAVESDFDATRAINEHPLTDLQS